MPRRLACLAILACIGTAACAGAIVGPELVPARPHGDALLVLPGFGYGRGGEEVFRSLAASMARDGIDLFVPTYLSRGGMPESREQLQRFMRARHLDQYQRLHVFAFIAGAWTINPLVAMDRPSNLTSVVYDRSPYQERAPRIADEHLHVLTWLRYGSPVFDVARTPYTPLTAAGVRVGLMVETRPTTFIKKHEDAARAYGAFHFECDTFMQRHDDCLYLSLNHEELYARFAEVWPEVLAFIRTGRFTDAANRTPPIADALAEGERR